MSELFRDSRFPLSGSKPIGGDANAVSLRFNRVDLLSQGNIRIYCKYGEHYLLKSEVKFGSDGRVLCGEHGFKVAIFHDAKRSVVVSEKHGDLELCCKPWLPCGLRVFMVNKFASGVFRKRVFCGGFKCELLDSPKNNTLKFQMEQCEMRELK